MTRKQSTVSLVRCDDYAPENVISAVNSALELAELTQLFGENRRILLKPNLLSARNPEEAVTTHPAVIEAVGTIAKERGCNLALGDSPPFAGENPAKYARLCDQTGAKRVAEALGARLVRFEEDVIPIQNPVGRFYRSFEVAREAVEADVVISIPKLKTHGLTLFTGAIKNVFGCVPGIRKGLFHVQAAEEREIFSQMLVDLLGVVRPSVNIMDAVVAMEGEGPNSGQPKAVGLIIASADPVALDAVACAIIGLDPMSVDTTRLAHEQGLGCGDLANIEIRGEKLQDSIVAGFRQSSGQNDWAKIPAPIRRLLRRQLVAVPRIDSKECKACGDCVRACPVHAIASGRPPRIDLSGCIRCYCCHEVCNFSAIDLKRGFLGRLLGRLLKS